MGTSFVSMHHWGHTTSFLLDALIPFSQLPEILQLLRASVHHEAEARRNRHFLRLEVAASARPGKAEMIPMSQPCGEVCCSVLVGVCVVHIHQRYPEAPRLRAHVQPSCTSFHPITFVSSADFFLDTTSPCLFTPDLLESSLY